MDAVQRITFDPEVCGGRPCVRGMRIRACLLYAAHCFRRYPGAANVGGATVSLARGNARGRPAP